MSLPACDSTGAFVSQNAGFYSPARKCGDTNSGFVSQNTTKLAIRSLTVAVRMTLLSWLRFAKTRPDSDNPARQCGDSSSWLRFAEPKTRRANQPVLRNFEDNHQCLHQNRPENTKAKSRPCYKEVASPIGQDHLRESRASSHAPPESRLRDVSAAAPARKRCRFEQSIRDIALRSGDLRHSSRFVRHKRQTPPTGAGSKFSVAQASRPLGRAPFRTTTAGSRLTITCGGY